MIYLRRLTGVIIAVMMLVRSVLAQEELDMAKIRSLLALGEYSEAAVLLEVAVKKEPSRYEYQLYLGNAYFAGNKLDKAIERYKLSLRLNSGAKEAAINLATAYSAKGLHAEAIEQYLTLLKDFGENPDIRYNLALAYRFSGDLKMAEKNIQSAIDQRPNDAEFINLLGELQVVTGRLDEAEKSYIKAIRVNPADGLSRVSLARLYFQQNDYRRAEEEAKIAAVMDSRLSSVHELLGDIYQAKGDNDLAIYEYNTAFSRNPGNPALLMNLGGVYEALKRFQDAKKYYLMAVEKKPASLEFRLKLSGLLIKMSSLFEARDILKEALDANAKNVQLLDMLGAVYMRLRNFEKSEYYLQEALKINPDFQKARMDLGLLMFEQGKYSSAESLLEEVRKTGFVSYELNLYLGRINLRKKNNDKALDFFKELVDMAPDLLESHLWVGRANEALLKPLEAESAFLRGIRVDSTNPDAYFEAADYYFRNRIVNKYPQCVGFYQKTLDMDSKYPKRDYIIENISIIEGKVKRIERVKTEKEIDADKKEQKRKSSLSPTD
ncbi:MAG: hypothetical protein A2293_08840 [Elusimicrobia bacterium RIFOXYB2_FULL_49_7]|nr:MAG: hypothetical protein A2293_08840 [Elusimicrobia bacterium RIFOXYB2_FULL_49_7]